MLRFILIVAFGLLSAGQSQAATAHSFAITITPTHVNTAILGGAFHVMSDDGDAGLFNLSLCSVNTDTTYGCEPTSLYSYDRSSSGLDLLLLGQTMAIGGDFLPTSGVVTIDERMVSCTGTISRLLLACGRTTVDSVPDDINPATGYAVANATLSGFTTRSADGFSAVQSLDSLGGWLVSDWSISGTIGNASISAVGGELRMAVTISCYLPEDSARDVCLDNVIAGTLVTTPLPGALPLLVVALCGAGALGRAAKRSRKLL